jgi:hypothetical protein
VKIEVHCVVRGESGRIARLLEKVGALAVALTRLDHCAVQDLSVPLSTIVYGGRLEHRDLFQIASWI